MKIAVYHNLPSGGAKRALCELTRRLSARHTLDVYSLSCAEHDFCDLRPYAREQVVFPFEPLRSVRHPFGQLNQALRTVDLLRLRAVQSHIAARVDALGYDVVLANHCRYGQSPALLQSIRTPAAYLCHEPPRTTCEPPVARPYLSFTLLQRIASRPDPLPAIYRRTLTRLDRANVLAATMVLANSYYSREMFYHYYGVLAHVAHLGVDTEQFRPLGLVREWFALSVGALNPHKGFDFLLQSLALLPPSQRLPLVIVSNFAQPAECRYLEALGEELGVPVRILVSISDEELVRLYNKARLVLYAPIMEPFGLVPLEAMACGTPVVGVREAGVRESVVHERTGLLADRDPRSFADAVARLLSDRELSESYGAFGREYVAQEWSWDRSASRLEEYLHRAACLR
jgi:glycosyltransferase involved in cell wall biosynthesis